MFIWGEEERTRVALAPLPVLVLGVLPFRPGHARSPRMHF